MLNDRNLDDVARRGRGGLSGSSVEEEEAGSVKN